MMFLSYSYKHTCELVFCEINSIAIEGRVVNWIESKALFGDEDTHNTYLDEQLISYRNR